MQAGFLQIDNGEAVPRDRVPHLDFDSFRRQAMEIVGSGGKVVQYFAYPENGTLKLLAVLRAGTLLVAGCDAPEAFASMAAECEPFHHVRAGDRRAIRRKTRGAPLAQDGALPSQLPGQTGCVRQ
jgi:hypothetical protein